MFEFGTKNANLATMLTGGFFVCFPLRKECLVLTEPSLEWGGVGNELLYLYVRQTCLVHSLVGVQMLLQKIFLF